MSKLNSACPEERFGKILQLCFFSDFEQKIFRRIVKTAFYVSGEHLGKFVFFFENHAVEAARIGKTPEKSIHTEGIVFLSY